MAKRNPSSFASTDMKLGIEKLKMIREIETFEFWFEKKQLE